MPNTQENQARYPQPSIQAPGVGFALARLVLVVCLAPGAALDAAIGPHQGKGSGELTLVRRLLADFRPGDVMLADALYCNYFLISSLMAAGVDVLMAQNGSRITDFRRGQSLGTREHIVRWPKPATRPQWMTSEQSAHAPDEIALREVRVAHQVLINTLVNHRQVRKNDLSALYARRWNIELDLRNLKTTCGMDVLRCQTPQVNEKQLWVHRLAYNATRLLMAQAASHAGVDPRGLSFKHTVQLWAQWTSRGLSATSNDQRAVHASRPMQGRPSTWPHRAAKPKTTVKTLPLDEGFPRRGSPTCPTARPCEEAKVSAIPPKAPLADRWIAS